MHVACLVLEAAQGRVLDRDGVRVVRVDLNQVAEAVEFVGLFRQVEAVVQALPFALGRLLRNAEALDVCGRALAGHRGSVCPVLVDVLLAGKEGAPRGHAARAVVEGAEHRGTGRVSGGLQQVVACRRAHNLELGLAGDTAVQRPELACELAGVLVAGHLEDRVAMAHDANVDLLVRRVLRVVVRQHLRLGGVLVGAHVHHAVLVRRVLHEAREVVVEAELARGGRCGLVIRIEFRCVLVDRIAPGDQHGGSVARGDDNFVLLVRLHALEAHALCWGDLCRSGFGDGVGGGRRRCLGLCGVVIHTARGQESAAAEGDGAGTEGLQHATTGHDVAKVRVVGLVGALARAGVAALVGAGQAGSLGLEQKVDTLQRHGNSPRNVYRNCSSQCRARQ